MHGAEENGTEPAKDDVTSYMRGVLDIATSMGWQAFATKVISDDWIEGDVAGIYQNCDFTICNKSKLPSGYTDPLDNLFNRFANILKMPRMYALLQWSNDAKVHGGFDIFSTAIWPPFLTFLYKEASMIFSLAKPTAFHRVSRGVWEHG